MVMNALSMISSTKARGIRFFGHAQFQRALDSRTWTLCKLADRQKKNTETYADEILKGFFQMKRIFTNPFEKRVIYVKRA